MTLRDFAIEVVTTLRNAGFEALWAGGCVRDQLLGRIPKDYDVATNARPDDIRRVFGRRRTVPIGAAFGVIAVIGPKPLGTIDVVTFRRDAAYSDGRHPDSVTFTNAAEDAARRDFTINGLFLDPLNEQVIDYVGGLQDLERRVVRAIGDPHRRIAEDKLRMMRAIRFAAGFEFELDAECLAAIREHAAEISHVSIERITAELRRMLQHSQRRRAAQLLVAARLLPMLLPEGCDAYVWDLDTGLGNKLWNDALAMLDRLDDNPPVAVALAILLRPICGPLAPQRLPVADLGARWRLTNEEQQIIGHVLEHEQVVLEAHQRFWPRVQQLLIRPYAVELVTYAAAAAGGVDGGVDGGEDGVRFCREKLALPAHLLNPPPLITGQDLRRLGIPPGPAYRVLLQTVRDAQLAGELTSPADALGWVSRQRQPECSDMP